jgi:putative (di)nucleoside polyphosphate hydrolase
MSDWIDSEGYRANVGIVLMRDTGEVFLGQRTGGKGWQFPQGGVRQGEPVEQALYRELQEENRTRARTRGHRGVDRRLDSLSPAEALRAPRSRAHLHRPEAALVPAAARGAGSLCAFSFTHTTEPEFDGWRWANYWEPVREVIYFKRPVYVQMLTELAPAAFPGGAPPLPEWWQTETAATAED